MEPAPRPPAETDVEALLRARRPQPDPHWVRATGEQLFPPRRSRLPSVAVRLGGAFAAGLAVLVLALSLAGVGPLGGHDRSVEASDKCRDVTVTRIERVPSLIIRAGRAQVVFVRKPVRRTVRRCR